MELATILLFVLAALSSLFMAWFIGAGSSGATPLDPTVGANAIGTMRAAFLVGISLPVRGVIVVLLMGAGLLAIGTSTGYPIGPIFVRWDVGRGLSSGGVVAQFAAVFETRFPIRADYASAYSFHTTSFRMEWLSSFVSAAVGPVSALRERPEIRRQAAFVVVTFVGMVGGLLGSWFDAPLSGVLEVRVTREATDRCCDLGPRLIEASQKINSHSISERSNFDESYCEKRPGLVSAE